MIIRPMIAAIMCDRAVSTAFSSPPDVSHFAPPQTKKKRAINPAITKKNEMSAPTVGPKSELPRQRFPNWPVGQVCPIEVAAKAEAVTTRNPPNVPPIMITFFIK